MSILRCRWLCFALSTFALLHSDLSAAVLLFSDADGTAIWSTSEVAWTDAGSPTVWVNGSSAQISNALSNSLTVSGSVSVESISQSVTGTQSLIDGGGFLTITGGGLTPVISNSSGSALTFGSSMLVSLNPATAGAAQRWNAALGSDIIVNGMLVGSLTGGLWKEGAGVLQLNSANDYSGYTYLKEGVVLASDASSFGSSSIVFNGGVLRYGAAVSGGYSSQFAAMNSASAILDTNGFNVTLNSPLYGSAGLVKRGSGILIVAAGSAYTGGTVVEAGILRSGAGTGTNPFGASGSMVTVKSGATLDTNWTTAGTYAQQYQLTIEGKGVADTSGTVFGGFVGALTSSGTYNNTASAFSSMLLTGDTTISGQLGGTSGQRYGVAPNIDARVRDSGGNVIANQYYTLTVVNGNALSWRGASTNNVYVGDIRLEQGRLWADADNFGDNNFSIYINANTVNATTVWGELGNWLGTRTVAKKTVMTGGLVALEGYQGSNSSKIDYGTVSTFTLSGQMTLNVSALADNRISATYSMRDAKVTGQITGTGGLRYIGATAALTDWDTTYTTSTTINRYSVLYLTNSTNDFTGTVKLDSGVIRMSDGTANGKLGGGSNTFSFNTTTAPAILDLFGTNQSIGALTGSSATNHFVQNNRQNTTSTLTVGNGGASGSFAGVLRDYAALPADNVAITNEGATNAKLALVKTGAGQQTLTGINTFSGGTVVNQGTLQVGSGATGQSTATLGNGAFTVNNGGILQGNGTLGFAGANSVVNSGGALRVGTVEQTTSRQYMTIGGNLTVNGTLAFDLWNTNSGSGTVTNSDALAFLTGSSFTLSSTAILNVTAKASAGTATSWAEGTWFQLFDFSNITLINRSVSLTNAANWVLPTLNGLYEWDFTRLQSEGRIYVVNKTVVPTLEFDPADSYTGTAEWKDDTGYLAWDDASVAGVSLQEWTNGMQAAFKNGASNSLNVVENVTAATLSQSQVGTTTTINSANSSKLTLSGTNRIVSNTSGSALTFGSGLTVDIAGTEKEWYTTSGSPIVVNGVITGAVGSYSAGVATGGLVKSGDGILELRGTNTYSGVTRLQAGAVLAVSDAAFGTSTVVFEGGILRYGAAVAGGYASQFAPLNFGASALLDTNSFNVTLNAALSGTAGLTKLGTGILTVAAGSTYTGGTVVEAGILKSGATAAGAKNAFGANNTQITVKSGATLDVNWADATNYDSAKYNLLVEGKGVADSTGTIAGGYVGAVVSSGGASMTASPFNLITLTGDATFAGRYLATGARWGITNINANGYNITFVNANGLSWAVGSSGAALNVRDIYIEQGHVYADGTFFGDDNYSIIVNASKPGANLFRGELRRYSSSGTITKKITINGGIVQFEGDSGGSASVPRTLTLAGQVTLMDNNTIAANRINGNAVNRDIKITGKITGTGGFEFQGTTGTYNYNGTTATDRYSVLTLTNATNDFTGAIKLIRGIIRMSDGASNGTLGAATNEFNFNTASSVAILDLFGTNQTIGALNGASATNHFVQNNRANSTATLTVGSGNANGSFDGVLRDYGTLPSGNASMNESTFTGDGATGAKLAFVKTGTGTQTLTGVSTFSGGTVVNQGVLQVGTGATGQSTAQLGSGIFTVNNGGTLAGNGIVGLAGSTSLVNAGGTLRVGTSTQTAAQRLDVAGGLTSSGTLAFEVWSVTLGSGSATNSDFLKFLSSDAVNLSGSLSLTNRSANSATTWTEGTWFQLIDWGTVAAGSRTVNFTDLSLMPTLGAGLYWDLTRLVTDGRVYVVVPEPGRAVLLLFGLAVVALRRRRRYV